MNYNSQAYLYTRLGSDNVSRCYSLEIYLYTSTILKVTLYGISGFLMLNYLYFRSVLNKFKLTHVYLQPHNLKIYPGIKTLKAVQMIDQLFTVCTNQDVQEVSQHTRDWLLLQQMCFCQNVWPTLATLHPHPLWVPLGLIKLAQDDTNNWLKMPLRQTKWSISLHSLKSVLSALC